MRETGDIGTARFLGSLFLVIALLSETSAAGVARAGWTALFLALLLAAMVAGRWFANLPRQALAVPALVALAEGLRTLGSPHHVHAAASFVIAALIATLAAESPPGAPNAAGWMRLRLALAVLVPALALASAWAVNKRPDVPWMSVAAANAVMHDQDPYAGHFDAFGRMVTGSADFAGYKYGPLMVLTYLPFVLAGGIAGIVALNLTTLALTALILRRFGPGGEPDLDAVLLLACPIVAMNALAYQVNDLQPVPALLLAFLLWRRHPGWAGLLLGVSLSMKSLPAPLALLMLVPRRPADMLRMAAGLGIGLLPTFVFLAINPRAFFDNIVLFNFVRLPDKGSWLTLAPPVVGSAVRYVAVALMLATGMMAWTRDWSVRGRLAGYVGLCLLLLLAAPVNFKNYWLWWLPALIPVLRLPADTPAYGAVNNLLAAAARD